jgi:hypothetical protein
MFSISFKSSAVLLLAVFTISCKHTPLDPPGDGSGNGGGGTVLLPCDPDTVYFSTSILPLLVSSCAIPGCHDPATAEDGVILNNYANIMNTGDVRPFDLDGSDLFEVITETDPDDRMPPANEFPPLSENEIDLIRTWILQGAKNNSCASACDTTNVTYNFSIKPLIEAKCQGCHSGANPQGGIALTDYNQISAVALFGTMLQAVEHSAGATPMPLNSPKLPDCEIDLIRIWIENGAPQ